ncbi:serpin B6-like [Vombatus ursinus]|uniref:serpin B6-like n=1 Tax=Vombatus ursinus TaxID=29139 RepID=UPI000FFDAA60|nr:serpin B6-like [Vombatus ursinus]XP_027732738.1 serpin B6-like [Vombatus ursinus]
MDILSEGNVTFAITLLKKLCEEKPRNVVFSPPSISFALNMILLGTKRETAAQIAQLLSLNRSKNTFWGFRSLLAEMNKSSTWYLIKTTNKLFGENTLNFLTSFRDSCFEFCNSVMEDVCFSQETETVRKHINAWVAEKTEGNISEALPDGLVDPLSLLVFVNAINFKATWERAFDPKHTDIDILKVNQHERTTLQIMKNKEEFLTSPLEELGGQLFIFPYRGMELTMILVFTSDSDLTKLEKGLTYERFLTWTKPEAMALMENHDKTFLLPKIKMEETCDLEHVLYSLGMSDAFDEQKADFSGMLMLKHLYLSKVLHTSCLEINEEGIKASAATIAAEIPAASKRDEELKANGFFLFFIWSYKTKSILFCGRVSSP